MINSFLTKSTIKMNQIQKIEVTPILADIHQLFARASVLWIDNTQNWIGTTSQALTDNSKTGLQSKIG